ncbi:terminase [Bacillus sp. LBG-1-113]|nr:terminase [Bacillus sp. LBG-1-113]MCC2929513.1 terminase [Bacillus sp. LBG-1-113]
MFNLTTDFHTELQNYPTLTYFSYDKSAANAPPSGGRGFWTCSVGKSYGHVIVMTYDNKTFRKSLANNKWSDWVELENTEGAQEKVNVHAGKSDIHVTQAEKDNWNNSQLFKVTADNGQAKINLSETDDFHEIVPKNTGMVHFTSMSKTLNGPGTSVRGIWTINVAGDYGQIIAFDNTNKTYRKTISGGNWSEWIELETTVGAQSKVSNHAMDSTAHITTEERNKWNAGQLSKITNDAGGVLVSIGDADDFLSKIVQTGKKFGTFYSTGKPTNAPSALSTRGFFHFTATDSNGNGTFGYVVAIDYKNNMFTNYVDGNLGWQGWNKVESEIGSQSKADKAVTDAKNYVDTNYTNEKLIVQQSSVAIQDARTPGTDYPLGITICTINNNNDTGYPLGYGMIKNEKWSHYRFAQYFYGNGDTTNGKNDHVGTWIRHWWNESGWTPWEKISGFAHAIIGRTGKQALNKGEQNKIIFKNIIKDSNNLFDLSNSRFIASHAGMYLVNASLYIENTLQYSNFELYAYVNGSQYKLMNQFRMPSPKDNDDSKEFYATVTGSATVPLNAGDYVEIYVYVGYTGTASRYIFDNPNSKNYFDILELGGRNFPTL